MTSPNTFSNERENKTAVLATTDFRNNRVPFGIKETDRRAHLYLIGKTGTGKSTLLETLMRHDIKAGNGFALLDPHGDLVQKICDLVPFERQSDLIDFDVSDERQPYGFNPLVGIRPERRSLAASGMLSVFKHLWNDSWGPRLEHLLRNSLLTLLEQRNATLADILRLFDDKDYRRKCVANLSNQQVKKFWLSEYEKYPERLRGEAIAPVQNKVGAFVTNPLLNRILTRPEKPLNLRSIMDSGKILLVNLAKGKIGEDTALLLGSLLISRMGLAALSRADTPEEERRDYYLYLDEFHSFTTLSLAQMLSELRKYRLNLILAHQYLAQLEIPIKDAILGNAGTMIAFRIGATDAELIAPEFAPEITATDLTNLPNYHIYLKMMIDGAVSKPFSAVTITPDSIKNPQPEFDDTS
jgi:energy-coupling factor transporter ATP-binding protein EcfA2